MKKLRTLSGFAYALLVNAFWFVPAGGHSSLR